MQDDWDAFQTEKNSVTSCATVQMYSSIHASCQRPTNETLAKNFLDSNEISGEFFLVWLCLVKRIENMLYSVYF